MQGFLKTPKWSVASVVVYSSVVMVTTSQVTGSHDRTLKIWDLRYKTCMCLEIRRCISKLLIAFTS